MHFLEDMRKQYRSISDELLACIEADRDKQREGLETARCTSCAGCKHAGACAAGADAASV